MRPLNMQPGYQSHRKKVREEIRGKLTLTALYTLVDGVLGTIVYKSRVELTEATKDEV